MRVAVVTAKFPCSRQSEAFFAEEARGLAQHVDLVIAPLRGTDARYYVVPNATIVAFPLFSASILRAAATAFARNPGRASAALLQVFRASPHTLLKNLSIFPKALALAEHFRKIGVEHVHAYWLSTPATASMIVAKVNGITWSATAHRWDIYEQNMCREKVESAKFVRTISMRGMADLAAAVPEPARRRLVCIPIGVELPSPGINGSHKLFTMLCPAALVPVKGHRILLKALWLLKREGLAFRCILAGDGPLRPSLQSYAAKLDIAKEVEFAGHIRHEELIQRMRRKEFDTTVLCSVESGTLMEGVPVALMESMAAGIPCIASASGSISELLGDGAGLLVPCDDAEAVMEALSRLANDASLRRLLADRARDRIRAKFEVNENARRLGEMLVSATNEERKVSA